MSVLFISKPLMPVFRDETGEEARNILGTVVIGSEEERNALTVKARRRACFTLLWCFE
jgi:hypothetical protein